MTSKHFIKEKTDEYNQKFPCKDCIVLASCKQKTALECFLLIDWLYYDSYNMDIVKFKKRIFLKLFNWGSYRYSVKYKKPYNYGSSGKICTIYRSEFDGYAFH